MIKSWFLALLFFLIISQTYAQQRYIDSLKNEVRIIKNDTLKLILFGQLSNAYTEISPDSAYYYSEKMLFLARKFNLKLEEVHALSEMGYALVNLGNYPRSLQTFLTALPIATDPKSERNILPEKFPSIDEFSDRTVSPERQRLDKLSRLVQYMGILYTNANNYEKALSYYLEASKIVEQSKNLRMQSIVYGTLGRAYLTLKKTDSALITEQKAYKIDTQINYKRYFGSILLNLGRVYMVMGNKQLAEDYFREAVAVSKENKYFRGVVASNLLLADIHRQSGEQDSVLSYIQGALPVAQFLDAPDLLLRSYTSL